MADVAIPAGKEMLINYKPVGIAGTNSGQIVLNSVQKIDFEKHFNYLLRYPYGCLEQTISAAFPQLYLSKADKENYKYRQKAQENVQIALSKLFSFQTVDGLFALWPNSINNDLYVSMYSLHFMIEAQRMGYTVNSKMLNRLVEAIHKAVYNISIEDRGRRNGDIVAYYYYLSTISPEVKNAAYNMEFGTYQPNKLSNFGLSLFCLSNYFGATCTYAEQLQKGLYSDNDYRNYYYGGKLRNWSILLMDAVNRKDETTARSFHSLIAKEIEQSTYYNTQSIAWVLNAVNKYYNWLGNPKTFSASITNTSGNANSTEINGVFNYLYAISNANQAQQYSFKNTGKSTIYLMLKGTGISAVGKEQAMTKNLSLSIQYIDINGNELDVTRLKTGTRFEAVVNIRPENIVSPANNMVLNYRLPAGWEIRNMSIEADASYNPFPGSTRSDLRDDRLFIHFVANPGAQLQFRIPLVASYVGKFNMPSSKVEDMYDPNLYAQTAGKAITILP
ncbi:MAG: putative lipoprotein YfhM [candidate division WS2 bacterium]|uniref:Lipoprotein YfhM n=1 Tax=Psychracetigena formicireducens TaxID=2986056 RepID=A0A9E2BJA1_PSYF1|nr:putative lipoprotein YfhM [Candidatus Psychracetigena formicireducens]